MTEIEFSQIPASEIHPVTRFGFDPLPGNKGQYVWVEETRTYEPGTYTHEFDIESGLFKRTGYKLKGKGA